VGVPVLERVSGLRFNQDFYAGYSPERINPGDKEHRITTIMKVTENTQRDLNIALMNELSMIFGRLGIDTHEVLAAAGTKWNFMPFKPSHTVAHARTCAIPG